MKKIIGLVVVGMVFLTQEARAADLYVPGDYTTIQAAINAAGSGERIIVSAGTYNEAIYINKNLTWLE
ncbi:MAG: hypothetical protein AB1414_17400 [bacterium]